MNLETMRVIGENSEDQGKKGTRENLGKLLAAYEFESNEGDRGSQRKIQKTRENRGKNRYEKDFRETIGGS